MATILRAETGHAGANGRYRIKAASFLICLAVSMLSIGVQAERMVMETWEEISGFHTFLSGHHVRLTIFEAGAPIVASRAVIELRNRSNRVVARKEGALQPTLQLDHKLTADAQLRALLRFELDPDQLTAPLVTFEDINPSLGLVFKVQPPCGPGSGRVDPQAYCPGWLILTSPQE
jgi:hypothetical protein